MRQGEKYRGHPKRLTKIRTKLEIRVWEEKRREITTYINSGISNA